MRWEVDTEKPHHIPPCPRYLYLPHKYKEEDGGDDETGAHHLFRRYQLSDQYTFASWFHPRKPEVLKLVDSFLYRTGKFALPGYPYKLGILLHGPPGGCGWDACTQMCGWAGGARM